MKLFFVVLGALFLGLAPSRARQALGGHPAQVSRLELADLREAVRSKLDEIRRSRHLPGALAGFVLPDGTSTAVAVGKQVDHPDAALPADARFLAGSIGKTLVAATALQLVGEGKISLDAKVSDWLADRLPIALLPNSSSITLRQLLSHSSGLPDHIYQQPFMEAVRSQPYRSWTPEELVAFIEGKPALFPPGKGWAYADTNYILAGMIIEKVTGRPLFSEIERRFLKPARLTGIIPATSRTLPRLASGYVAPGNPLGFEGPTLVNQELIINPQVEWAGGGFAATAEDLARWGHWLLSGNALSPSMKAEMLHAIPASTGEGDGYGLGIQVRNTARGKSYGHSGWFPGYLSDLEYIPSLGITVAISLNTDGDGQFRKNPAAYVIELADAIAAAEKPGPR